LVIKKKKKKFFWQEKYSIFFTLFGFKKQNFIFRFFNFKKNSEYLEMSKSQEKDLNDLSE
jgi:hypothetical protein